MQKMLKLRSFHFPVQYICGYWEFMNLNLKIKPPILIPRFQTEQMLAILFQNEKFIQKIDELKAQNIQFSFLQLGCGSGAIGLALSKYFQSNHIKYRGQMIDIQEKAVQLSLLNLKRNNLDPNKIRIRQQNMVSMLQEKQCNYFQSFDLVISNPPYISVRQYNSTLERQVRKYESKKALVGDQNLNIDGLFYVQKIISVISKCSNQLKPIIVMQYGGQDLSHLGQNIQKSVIKDYYQKRRFIFMFPD